MQKEKLKIGAKRKAKVKMKNPKINFALCSLNSKLLMQKDEFKIKDYNG